MFKKEKLRKQVFDVNDNFRNRISVIYNKFSNEGLYFHLSPYIRYCIRNKNFINDFICSKEQIQTTAKKKFKTKKTKTTISLYKSEYEKINSIKNDMRDKNEFFNVKKFIFWCIFNNNSIESYIGLIKKHNKDGMYIN